MSHEIVITAGSFLLATVGMAGWFLQHLLLPCKIILLTSLYCLSPPSINHSVIIDNYSLKCWAVRNRCFFLTSWEKRKRYSDSRLGWYDVWHPVTTFQEVKWGSSSGVIADTMYLKKKKRESRKVIKEV